MSSLQKETPHEAAFPISRALASQREVSSYQKRTDSQEAFGGDHQSSSALATQENPLYLDKYGRLLNGEECALWVGQQPDDIDRLDELATECARAQLPGSAKDIVRSLLLVSCVTKEGRRIAYPSPAPLARIHRVSEETVRRSLRTLEKIGVLVKAGSAWVAYETSGGQRRALLSCFRINFGWKAFNGGATQGDFFDSEWKRQGFPDIEELKRSEQKCAPITEQPTTVNDKDEKAMSAAGQVAAQTDPTTPRTAAPSVNNVGLAEPLASLVATFGLTSHELDALREDATKHGHNLEDVVAFLRTNPRAKLNNTAYVTRDGVIPYLQACIARKPPGHYQNKSRTPAGQLAGPERTRQTLENGTILGVALGANDINSCDGLSVLLSNGDEWTVDGRFVYLRRSNGTEASCPISFEVVANVIEQTVSILKLPTAPSVTLSMLLSQKKTLLAFAAD